jgi:hypothetical protein
MLSLPAGGRVGFFSSIFRGVWYLFEAVKVKGRIFPRTSASWGQKWFSLPRRFF